jgi:pyruvate dehydrogenase kinase 2/3/4
MKLGYEYLIRVWASLFIVKYHDLLHSLGGGLSSPHITSPSDLFSFSHMRNSGRMEQSRLGALRTVSSSESGLRATLNEQIGRWQNAGPLSPYAPPTAETEEQLKTSPEEKAGVGTHYPIGIGLPMSNIFATYYFFLSIFVQRGNTHNFDFRYFGGSLELVSLDGWGALLC